MLEIIKKVKRRFSNLNTLEMKNYYDAEKYCENINNDCYQSEILCKYRFEKMDKVLKENNQFFLPPSINILLKSIKFFIQSSNKNTPSFVDFGGACGENILFLESIFGTEIYNSSWIIETPAQVEESKRWDFSKKINFSSDLNNVLENNNVDIFFTSCAINYLKNPYDPLLKVVSNKVPYVILTRNNFSKNTLFYAQRSKLSSNGNGKHLKKYKDREIWYPSSTLSEIKIMDIFKKKYSLKLGKNFDNTGVLNNKCYSKDLIFQIKD